MIRQADIARHLALEPIVISRALKAMGRNGTPMSEDAALGLLAAGEINRLGHSWPEAINIVRRFDGEIRYLARDPGNQAWLVHLERPDQSFWVSCLTSRHLVSILDANPSVLLLNFRPPVTRALDAFESLQQMKGAA